MRIFFLFLWIGVSVNLLAQQPPSAAPSMAPGRSHSDRSENIATPPRPEEVVNGYYYRYLYCDPLPSAQARAAVEARGVQFLSYVAKNTYLAALPVGLVEEQLAAVQVRRLWPVLPRDKMNQNLLQPPYGAWAMDGDRVHVYVQVYPQVRIEEAGERLRALGYAVVAEGNQNGFLHLLLRPAELETLAALPWVRYLELPPPPSEPEDVNGRAMHRTALLDMESPLGRKYDGSGVVAVVRDDGPLGPHIDFQGRYTDWNAADAGTDGTHGDGVAGILGGAGNLDPRMRGMAAGVHLYTVRYEPSFQDATLLLHLAHGATITNTSYSDGCNAGYTLSAQTVERQLYDYPELMHVFSAGNDGSSNCNYGAGPGWGNITGGHKMAKNSLSVANLRVDGTLMHTSSRGPAHDGRLKPDLAAHGQGQGSTAHEHTYRPFGGTSAAAPGVAGVLAQLMQAYREHFNGQQPPAALLKAALLNTANDLGNPGPDFSFGWGLVNAWRAYRLLTEERWLRGAVEHQTVMTHALVVPPGVRQGRIMLYWADVPAEAGAKRALVNDLDLHVVGPDGTVYQPLVLDHRPVASALMAPAQPGRDSINNVEQVALLDPLPGVYTIRVRGQEVPFGPSPYYVVWDYDYDSLKLVYPTGGEGLAPGDTCYLHWDAFGTSEPFLLHYSLDDGQTWLPIEALPGEQRMHLWRVPEAASGLVRVRVSRGSQSDQSEFPLSIVGVPTGLKVERVCLDSATLSWQPLADTLHYDVYLLGKKYMELAGTTAVPRITLPIVQPGEEKWFSVRAVLPSGGAGRRALAVQWAGGLKECPQSHDLALRQIIAPRATDIESAISCEPTTWTVRVRIANDGLLPASGASVIYQLNDEPPVAEPLPELQPGSSLDVTFATPFTLTQSGSHQLRVWVSFVEEKAFFNDTLSLRFRASIGTVNTYFTETFTEALFPPERWVVVNPDNDITWRRSSTPVVGADGNTTFATFMNFYNYTKTGEKDYLYLPPLDLSQLPGARLVFQWAYAPFSDGIIEDALRVEALPNCQLHASPVVLWTRSGSSLATQAPTSSAFFPDAATHWRRASIPLDSFAGQRLLLRLVAENDYGNNLFLDDIGIVVEQDTTRPQAFIYASADTFCRAVDTVRFWTGPAHPDFQYMWHFGLGSQPITASGAGPHAVRFITAGGRQVRLIASNAVLADTAYYAVLALGTPIADFYWTAALNTVVFTNTSANAETYEWDFGDGNTSTAANPIHVYAQPGVYTVTLRVRNRCSTNSVARIQTIEVDFVSTREPEEVTFARVVPNPSTGAFALQVTVRQPLIGRVALLDARGRLLETRTEALPPGEHVIRFDAQPLNAGVYLLHLHTPSGTLVRRVVITP